jgi:transposase
MEDRQAYDTDLTDAEWDRLEPLVPAAKPGGRPPKHTRRESAFEKLRHAASRRTMSRIMAM